MREIEITFGLGPEEVRHVYSAMRSLVKWNGRPLAVRVHPPRSVLHFYLKPTVAGHTRRIRVKRRRELMVAALEVKHRLTEDIFQTEKEESQEESDLSLSETGRLLSQGDPVVSAFIKNQYRFHYRSGGVRFKASLDHMLPFRVDDSLALGPSFWHLEIEAIYGWSPASFLESEYFGRHLAGWLHPLQESKWQTARMGFPAGIKCLSVASLSEFLRSLFLRGEEEYAPMGCAQTQAGSPAAQLRRATPG
ncbi:hypothetical protein ACU635_61035 [[Actinomadura] parvosata]|uniref:hypothetical protein n=1 Tax=[Actinomadura] parvosata TaxID=1955412 RepID=UPI00406CE38B